MPDQGGVAILVAHAEQRAIDRIEGQVADARVLEQHPRLAGAEVERHQVAVGDVVGGVEEGARCGSKAVEVTMYFIGPLTSTSRSTSPSASDTVPTCDTTPGYRKAPISVVGRVDEGRGRPSRRCAG